MTSGDLDLEHITTQKYRLMGSAMGYLPGMSYFPYVEYFLSYRFQSVSGKRAGIHSKWGNSVKALISGLISL